MPIDNLQSAIENQRIAVIGGTGQQGRGLAQRFALAGMPVVIGSRDPDRALGVVAGWGQAAQSIGVATNAAAVAGAQIVVLTVPFQSVAALLDDVRQKLSGGTLVIDVTVPVTFTAGKMELSAVPEGSASEHIRARLPENVGLAGAFKTLPAHVLDDVSTPLDCDEFVCGDSEDARLRASALVRLLPSLRPVDVGPLSRARFIEHATALAIAVNRRHKIQTARYRVVGLP
jgi:8-hydroxy-5-deazaflavin:NADPH oxidoreductase